MRGLLALVAIALLVYALIDCSRTPAAEIPLLPRGIWLLLLLVLPFVGPVSWLVLSRSTDASIPRGPGGLGGLGGFGGSGGSGGSGGRGPAGRGGLGGQGGVGRPRTPRGPVGPDDDPDFLRGL